MKFLSKFSRNSDGAVGLMAVLIIVFVVFAVLTVGIDLSKSQTAYTSTQGSTDAAALAAADHVLRAYKLEGKFVLTKSAIDHAKEIYVKNNFADNAIAQDLPSSFNVTLNGKTVTVTACTQTTNDFAAKKNTNVCTSSSAIIDNPIGKEIAIVVDNGSEMLKTIGGGTSGTSRLQYLKSSLNGLTNKFALKHNNSIFQDKYTVSIVPYADTVLLNKGMANNWLRSPFGNINDFSGCVGMHGNSYDQLDDAPVNAATKYDRYKDLLDQTDKVRVAAYSVYGTQIPGFAYRALTKNSNSFTLHFNDRVDSNSWSPSATVRGSAVGHPDRFRSEIDFIPGHGSEAVLIDLGGEYATTVNANFGWISNNDGKGRPELGRYEFLDKDYKYITHGDFAGNPTTGLNLALTGSSPRKYRYIKFTALNNGGGYGNASAFPHRQAAYPDNSDYNIYSVSFPLIAATPCNLQQTIPLTTSKTSIDVAVSGLKTHASTRNNIGLAWGWRSISPKFRGYWTGIASGAPLNYANMNKYIVMVVNSANQFPASDDAAQLALCNSIKATGTRLFFVTFDANAATQSLAQQCSSPNSFHNAPSATALNTAFNAIANEVNYELPLIKLVK